MSRLAAAERDGEEEPAAVGVPGHQGIAGHPAILLVRSEDGGGRKAAIRERPGRRGEAGSGGLPGLDVHGAFRHRLVKEALETGARGPNVTTALDQGRLQGLRRLCRRVRCRQDEHRN
jgi:hypothetical protein